MSGRLVRGGSLLAVVFAAALVFGPALLRHEAFTTRDHADYFQPLRLFTASSLRAGRLPLWNPYNASGEPWLANPQTGVFYPPAWLFVVLPFATAYVLYLALHALLLGAGAWLLLARRSSPAAAAAAAAGLMMSGPVLSLLDVSNNFTTFAWVPLILWRATRDREGEASQRAAAILLAMAFLAGEPFFAAVAAVVWAVIVRRPRVVAAVAAGAAALAAVQALPFIEMTLASDRVGGFRAADVLRESFAPAEYARLLLPPRLVGKLAPSSEQFIAVPYLGALVIILAIAGAASLLLRGEWRRVAVCFGAIGVTLLVAAGGQWIARLPVTLFRYPARVLPFAALATAALAAAGWDAFRTRMLAASRDRIRVADAVVAAAIVIDLFVAVRPLLATGVPPAARVPYSPGIGRDGKFMRLSDPVLAGNAARAAWMAGYLNLQQRRFDAWTAAPAVSRAYSSLHARARHDLAVLRSIGVAYVLSDRPMASPFVPLEQSGQVFVSRYAPALPLAYIRTASGLQPPRSLAVEPSRVNVSVVTSGGGTLVLTQNDAPGWRVTIDGRSARGKREMGTFRSVDVPAGGHQVSWIYRPRSLQFGAAASLLGLLWVVSGVFRGARRR